MLQSYYIPYDETLDINYKYILGLYQLASYDKEKERFCYIKFSTIKELNLRLKNNTLVDISDTTLRNILKDQRYEKLIKYDPKEKTIEINNDIKHCRKFVILSAAEANLIMTIEDKLFGKYLLYLKYYCGKSKSKTIDTTAAQFLEACGYCKTSTSYKNKLTGYNTILCRKGILTIKHYTDQNKRYRCIYRFN